VKSIYSHSPRSAEGFHVGKEKMLRGNHHDKTDYIAK